MWPHELEHGVTIYHHSTMDIPIKVDCASSRQLKQDDVKEDDFEDQSSTASTTQSVMPFMAYDQAATNIHSSIARIELEILNHPEVDAHFDSVCFYLKIDLVLLEAISYLRQEGLWSSQMSQIYGASVQAPRPEQIEELASFHQSLFQSPPTNLFNLICDFRKLTGFGPSVMTDRLPSLLKLSIQNRKRRKQGRMRTAPLGQLYACPSSKCHKTFKKSGHARNHVETKHPEYLEIHPNYLPHRFVVDDVPTVPTLEFQTSADDEGTSASPSDSIDSGQINKTKSRFSRSRSRNSDRRTGFTKNSNDWR